VHEKKVNEGQAEVLSRQVEKVVCCVPPKSVFGGSELQSESFSKRDELADSRWKDPLVISLVFHFVGEKPSPSLENATLLSSGSGITHNKVRSGWRDTLCSVDALEWGFWVLQLCLQILKS